MESSYAYEKLGLFYLGRELDLANMTPSPTPLLYRSRDMTTHGAIIGMTGSGKTGLGIALIEEAIMDNIPSIVIDPKGDMGNLLLTFPELRPEDFLPWMDSSEAARKDLSIEELAVKTAESWRQGLKSWDQDGERILALRRKTTMTVYTPGSSAGVPVSVLSNFSAPAEEVLYDTDTLNGLVNSTTTSLLALINVKGDPLQSREHILISSIFLHFWRKGEGLTMESLIGNIVNPPFEKIGVFSLDTFYGQSDRMQLAMSLNNILASPTFGAWTQGEPLDIQRILYTEEGQPRTAIFSIAHLSETERMFFVTMLLNRFIGWMRHQQGTSSLKALLYMDEIFGYFPPTANPPSKKPMMLLLKQARAYGCGVVLATQNPVDLDYKGLSNIGSWFVGRLQTNQDQDRVAEGIAGASEGKLDAGKVRKMLGNMKGRQFLLNSVHLDEPVLFETRWVLSYLKGPISGADIQLLMADRKHQGAEMAAAGLPPRVHAEQRGGTDSQPPVLSPEIQQCYFLQNIASEHVTFEPWLAASGNVRFYNASRNIEEVREIRCRLYIDDQFARPQWAEVEEIPFSLGECLTSPPGASNYYPLPSAMSSLKNLEPLKKTFSDHLYQNERLELFRVQEYKLESRPGESLGDFKVRLQDLSRAKKDEAVEKLRTKYKAKQQRLEQQLQNALYRLEKEQLDVKSRTTDTIVSFGVAVVGALFGRKSLSAGNVSRAATGLRNVGRVAKEKGDVKRAKEQAEELRAELAQLTEEIEQQLAELSSSYHVDNFKIETFSIKPRRSDIYDIQMCLLWEMVIPQQS
jgi:hypothetical protein